MSSITVSGQRFNDAEDPFFRLTIMSLGLSHIGAKRGEPGAGWHRAIGDERWQSKTRSSVGTAFISAPLWRVAMGAC